MELNDQIMKDHGVSRNDRFEKERLHLQPVPNDAFEISEWKSLKVHPDCHIQAGKSFYSVPFQYVGQTVKVRLGDRRVEVFDPATLERVALHSRSQKDFASITHESHYPPEKLLNRNFTIELAKRKSSEIGPHFEALVETVFGFKHPLRFLRPVQGWIRLFTGRAYSRKALEYGAKMMLTHHQYRTAYFKQCCSHFERTSGTPNLETSKSTLQRNPKYTLLHSESGDTK
jgi:hypothetical protein